MNKTQSKEVLEEGKIYLFYKARIGSYPDKDKEVTDITDIQHPYITLHPYKVGLYLLVPDIDKRTKHWALVDLIISDLNDIKIAFSEKEYNTLTRDTRTIAQAIPCREEVYSIIYQEKQIYLAYCLEIPNFLNKVQTDLNIAPEVSYVIIIKNSNLHSPSFFEKSPAYPKDLPFILANPINLMNYENVQLVFKVTSEKENISCRLVKNLSLEDSGLLKDLVLNKEKIFKEPLFKGE